MNKIGLGILAIIILIGLGIKKLFESLALRILIFGYLGLTLIKYAIMLYKPLMLDIINILPNIVLPNISVSAFCVILLVTGSCFISYNERVK